MTLGTVEGRGLFFITSGLVKVLFGGGLVINRTPVLLAVGQRSGAAVAASKPVKTASFGSAFSVIAVKQYEVYLINIIVACFSKSLLSSPASYSSSIAWVAYQTLIG